MKMRKRLLVSVRLAAASSAVLKSPSVGFDEVVECFGYCWLGLGSEVQNDFLVCGIVVQVELPNLQQL